MKKLGEKVHSKKEKRNGDKGEGNIEKGSVKVEKESWGKSGERNSREKVEWE